MGISGPLSEDALFTRKGAADYLRISGTKLDELRQWGLLQAVAYGKRGVRFTLRSLKGLLRSSSESA